MRGREQGAAAGYSKGGAGGGGTDIARGSFQTAYLSLPVPGSGSGRAAAAGGGQGDDRDAGDYRGDGAGIGGDGGGIRRYIADWQPQYAELPATASGGTP